MEQKQTVLPMRVLLLKGSAVNSTQSVCKLDVYEVLL